LTNRKKEFKLSWWW